MEVMLMIIFFTIFWAAVAKFGPLLVTKDPHDDLVRCIFLLTAVVCWLFWLCCYLAQLNPLLGPKLNGNTIRIIAASWGNPIKEG
ncbi:V-type proton ATPase subunit e [Drosophila takahashii]|uniref:V-type proton ATPase subunit e n=1 Tax=Drosophila takahashii TaxID=29030 RepID=UPI001CF84C2B|nr:V-type proton ATPase subunit e [Drosophila takahashii]